MFLNPNQFAVNKFIFNILQEKYAIHSQIVERTGHYLATEQDTMDFLKMLAAIYETAYMKGIDDFREGLRKQGYYFDATFTPQNSA